ncbi:hypothetical protein AKJ66_00130 [candidate division MSBL1 archaeon SCGC-AAA259E22]|uniref:Uncharacterized protein n=1 Tax=candidate division MSBL1 archaeon SCGC-AAA259E22 TaxID=1698265 RepID=A0A133UIL0_9EURY|nr:hypothetical protein AKJ66_00130 [candidate division MSBL1 archaeon SCGC-AAA259E22]
MAEKRWHTERGKVGAEDWIAKRKSYGSRLSLEDIKGKLRREKTFWVEFFHPFSRRYLKLLGEALVDYMEEDKPDSAWAMPNIEGTEEPVRISRRDVTSKLVEFEWVRIVWGDMKNVEKALFITPIDMMLRVDFRKGEQPTWPTRVKEIETSPHDDQPVQMERSWPRGERYEVAKSRVCQERATTVKGPVKGEPVGSFEGLEKTWDRIRKYQLTPGQLLWLITALSKYDSDARAPFGEEDLISQDEYQEAWEEMHKGGGPPPRHGRIRDEVRDPLQDKGLIHYYPLEVAEHGRWRLTAKGYRLFRPRYPEWDHTKKTHRRAGESLARVAARRKMVPLILFHGVKEIRKSLDAGKKDIRHADVPMVPPRWGENYAEEVAKQWDFNRAIMGQVVPDPWNNRELVEDAVDDAVELNRRVCFPSWTAEQADRIFELASEELPPEYHVGFGLDYIWHDELIIIQPIPLNLQGEVEERYERWMELSNLAERVLDTEAADMEIKEGVDGYYRIYDPKTGGQEYLGKAAGELKKIVEDRPTAVRYASLFDDEDPTRDRLEEFEKALSKELRKPDPERDIYVRSKDPAFVAVDGEIFPGEAYLRKCREFIA